MASSFLKSTTTLFLILSALISITIADIVDTDGDLLVNGGTYYILPVTAGFLGGLTLTPKSETSPCPYYIAPDKNEVSNGTPVTITSPFKISHIRPNDPVSLAFLEIPNICMRPLGWQVIPDDKSNKFYVATGGSVFNPIFSIAEIEQNKNVYVINGVGFVEDGLLGLNKENPLPVVFKKASKDVFAKV